MRVHQNLDPERLSDAIGRRVLELLDQSSANQETWLCQSVYAFKAGVLRVESRLMAPEAHELVIVRSEALCGVSGWISRGACHLYGESRFVQKKARKLFVLLRKLEDEFCRVHNVSSSDGLRAYRERAGSSIGLHASGKLTGDSNKAMP